MYAENYKILMNTSRQHSRKQVHRFHGSEDSMFLGGQFALIGSRDSSNANQNPRRLFFFFSL